MPGSRSASSRTSLVAVSYRRSTTPNATGASSPSRGCAPLSLPGGRDPGQTDAGRHRGALGRALGGRRHLPLRPHRRARRRVLDRHAAADGVRLDPHGHRVRLHPDRRHRPLPADGRQGGLLPDRLGRQRPGHRAPGAELLRRALRPEPAVRRRTSRRRSAATPRPARRRCRSRGPTSSSCATS